MTNQEAKKNIVAYMCYAIDDLPEDVGKALDIAIKALEQEPCDNAVSRQAALDAMYELCNTGETLEENPWRDNPHIDAITDAINNLQPVNPQKPCGDAISRQAVLDKKVLVELEDGQSFYCISPEDVETLTPIDPQEPKTGQFAKWVATEIFDDNWEYNKDAFEELACRKLEKLGIVRANGDEWELVEPQEKE